MAAQSATAVFRRTLDTRWAAFRNAIDAAIRGFGLGADKNQKHALLSTLHSAAINLRDILAAQDQPPWLATVIQKAQDYTGNPVGETGNAFLDAIVANHHKFQPIVLVEEDRVDCDFDKIFEQLREAHQLTDLFDRLVMEITAIIESGELDSVVAIAALQRMAAALRANRSGSYSAMTGSFDMANYGWNIVAEFAKEIPGVAPFMNAAEKTMEQAEAEIEKVKQEMRDAAQERLLAALPALEKIAILLDRLPKSRDTNRLAPPMAIEDVEFEKIEGPK